MQVCYIINQLAPGGAPTLLLDIIRNSTSSDISYTVCFIEGDDELAEPLRNEGARVVDLDADFKFDPRALYRMFHLFRQNNYDIIHAHLPYSQTLARIVSKLTDNGPVISTQHNVPQKYHPITRTLERSTRSFDSATVAVSEGVERQFRGTAQRYNPPLDEQWCTIYNGVDINTFNRKVQEADVESIRSQYGIDSNITFLNVARYVPAKAQHDLLEAMRIVVEELPEAQLFMVGWGERKESLRQHVREVNLENNVTITGRVPTVHEYYAVADAFVSSATFEGLPITHLEALAAELPVIATAIPGVEEVIDDGKTGVLVPPRDPSRLASAMVSMADPERREGFRRRGFERVRSEFSIEQTVEAHHTLYRDVAGVTNERTE